LGDYDKSIKDYSEAIRLNPEMHDAYQNLALLLASCPNDKLRDGASAIEYATAACELSHWKNGNDLAILAAAFAEVGDWEMAVKRQQEYIAMAQLESEKTLGRQRLELYKIKKAYREEPKPLTSMPIVKSSSQ